MIHANNNPILITLEDGKRWQSQDKEAAAKVAKLAASAPELLNACIALRQFIVDNIDKLPDSQDVRLVGLKAIVNAR